MTPVDWDRLDRLVRVAGRSWCRHRLWPDLRQEGLVVAWQNRDLSDGFIVTKARGRIIDVARQELGRAGQKRQAELLIVDTLPVDTFTRSHVDESNPVVEWALEGRERDIAVRYLAGASKREISDSLGVSPSRVSQLLTLWRARLVAA